VRGALDGIVEIFEAGTFLVATAAIKAAEKTEV
jgi:hypothetical protein